MATKKVNKGTGVLASVRKEFAEIIAEHKMKKAKSTILALLTKQDELVKKKESLALQAELVEEDISKIEEQLAEYQ